jgi:rhodanese-related sulfurtransferase
MNSQQTQQATSHKTPQLARAELQARMQANPQLVLLEALPLRYFEQSHLPGAMPFDHTAVAAEAARKLPDRDAEIVTYCASASCQNSHQAAHALRALGYGRVAVYAGGKQDWVDAGGPVEAGAPQ